MNDVKPPQMPPLRDLGLDLLRVSRGQRLLTLAYPFLWSAGYFGCAYFEIWAGAVGCAIALSFITYGSTSHDLVHRNLGLARPINDWLLCIIELLAIRSGHAYQAAHLHHHARFPHTDDIEALASRYSFLGAIAEGFVFQFRIVRWALRNAKAQRIWIVGETLVCLLWLVAAVLTFPYTLIIAAHVALMVMGSWIIPLITSYLPHDPHGASELSQTRAFRGTVASVLAVEHLYHLEHHLFPAVPHTNWRTLAQRLDPHFREAGVKPVVFWF